MSNAIPMSSAALVPAPRTEDRYVPYVPETPPGHTVAAMLPKIPFAHQEPTSSLSALRELNAGFARIHSAEQALARSRTYGDAAAAGFAAAVRGSATHLANAGLWVARHGASQAKVGGALVVASLSLAGQAAAFDKESAQRPGQPIAMRVGLTSQFDDAAWLRPSAHDAIKPSSS